MEPREAKWAPDNSKNIEKLSIAQSYEEKLSYHKGHIVIYFKNNQCVPALEQKIKELSGVDRTESFNHNTGLMISIKDSSDAFDVMKEVCGIMFEKQLISQKEVAAIYKEMDKSEKGTQSGRAV